ncbi:MAG: hypothetical protein PUP92_31650 [Rhizonema sp. PD38]|nr:hypothetical protein [Rhizonema sp. PD38]
MTNSKISPTGSGETPTLILSLATVVVLLAAGVADGFTVVLLPSRRKNT